MTHSQLIEFNREICGEAASLMERKNHDYSSVTDPFRNFRKHGPQGIMVRLEDKLIRLENFIAKGELKVKDESIRDTVVDIINYSILAYAMLKEND